MADYRSDAGSTRHTTYLPLTGELWGAFCKYLWENWPRYNGTALYCIVYTIISSYPIMSYLRLMNSNHYKEMAASTGSRGRPGLLFTKWTDVLRQDLVKSRSREIRVSTSLIALKFVRHLGSSAAEMPVKFQSDTRIITSNLAASRLHEIWW